LRRSSRKVAKFWACKQSQTMLMLQLSEKRSIPVPYFWLRNQQPAAHNY
jgi:hypothetical protein